MTRLRQKNRVRGIVAPDQGKWSSAQNGGAGIWTLGTTFFVVVVTALQGVVVARVLGPAERGELAAAVLWPMTFAAVGTLGVDVAVARAAAKSVSVGALARTGTVLAIGTATVTVALAMLLLPVVLPEDARSPLQLAVLACAVIPLNHLNLVFQGIEQGTGRFAVLNASRSVLNPIYLAATLVLWRLDAATPRALVWGLLASNAAVLLLLAGSRWRDFAFGSDLEAPWPIVRDGFPYWWTALGSVLHQRLDQMLLVWLVSSRDLGVYVVGLAVAGVAGAVGTSAGIVTFARSAQREQGSGFDIVTSTFRQTAVSGMLVALLMAASVPWIVPIVYGARYSDSAGLATVLVGGIVLAGLAQVLDQSLRGQGAPLLGFVGRMMALMSMAVLAMFLIPRLGTIGMAVAYGASQAVYLGVMVRSAQSHFKAASVSAFIPSIRDILHIVNRAAAVFRRGA